MKEELKQGITTIAGQLKNLRVERIFLIISILYGVLLVAVYPPFQGPDENSHYYRIHKLSQFKIIATQNSDGITGDYVEKSLPQTMHEAGQGVGFKKKKRIDIAQNLKLMANPIHNDEPVFVYMPAAVYSPVPYIPQIAGVTIGKIMFESPILLMYMGRLFNLAVWIVLVFFAIKIIPIFKNVMMLLALTPMSISQSATLSVDGVTNGLSFLLMAVILNIAYTEKNHLTVRDVIVLLSLGIGLALCKQIYILLLLLYFVIPRERAGSVKRYFVVFLVIITASILANALWWSQVRNLMHVNPLHEHYADISIQEQMRYILADPLRYIGIVVSTLIHKQMYHISFIGKLGWMDTRMPYFLIYSYLAVLFLVSITEGGGAKIGIRDKTLFFITASALMGAVLTVHYLAWSVVGDYTIRGVQGRYFISFSPLVFLLIYNRFFPRYFCAKEGLKKALLGVFCLFSALTTLTTMALRYYGA